MLSAVFVTEFNSFRASCRKVVLIKADSCIPLAYLQNSLHLQLTKYGNLLQWVPRASAMDHQHTQICTKC